MNDDANNEAQPRVPKYKAPDFMRKAMGIWLPEPTSRR